MKIIMVSLLVLSLATGCSGTYHAYFQTLQIAFSKQTDAEKSLENVQESEIDIISVRRGGRPAAIMALAYIENGQHKWVSSDNAMLVLEKGRIIRTLGLSDNQLYVSNTDCDPLKSLSSLTAIKAQTQRQTWFRKADQTGDEYGYPINSIFSQPQQAILKELNLNIKTTLYVESVNYSAPSSYIRLDNDWKNHFWYAKSGELIKSIEKVSPLSESLEITYLSRIARLHQ